MSDLPDTQETIEGLTEVTRHGSTFSVGGSGQSFYDLTLLRNALTLLNAQQGRIAELESKLAQEGGYKVLLEASKLVWELHKEELEAQVAKMFGELNYAELRIQDLRARNGR